ncbi:MAG: bifunctional metallophosphatase/5'-nucleotidase [Lachnospirales bacterium]
MKNIIKSLAVASVVTFTTFASTVYAEEVKEIIILGTSKVNGDILSYNYFDETNSEKGFAKIATVVKEEKENGELLLLDTGDTISGDYMELFKEDSLHPAIKAMNEIKYDIWTLGEDDFNLGKDTLDKAIKAFKGTTLSANIKNADGNDYVEPYVLKKINGIRVGIIGLSNPSTAYYQDNVAENCGEITFIDTIDSIKKAVEKLEGRVDVLVGAFHLGLENDYYGDKNDNVKAIAEAVPELDVIFTGNGEPFAKEYDEDTLILNAGDDIAKVTLELEKKDGEYKITTKKSTLINLDGVTPDKDFKKEFENVDDKIKKISTTEIGSIKGDVLPEQELIGVPTVLIQDTALMDIINDAQLKYSGADVSATPVFNLDMDFSEKAVYTKDITKFYPEDYTLVTFEITGKELKKYMEWSANFINTFDSGDANISFNEDISYRDFDIFAGLDYTIDQNKKEGNKISYMRINNKDIKEDDIITLAVNSSRIPVLKELGIIDAKEKPIYNSETTDQETVKEILADYFRSSPKGVVQVSADDNWRIENKPDKNTAEYEEFRKIVHYGFFSVDGTAKHPSKDGVNFKETNITDAVKKLNEGMNNPEATEKIKALIDDNQISSIGDLFKDSYDIIMDTCFK